MDLLVALTGQADAGQTLVAHPLVGQADQAQRLTDRLIAENAPYLPWA